MPGKKIGLGDLFKEYIEIRLDILYAAPEHGMVSHKTVAEAEKRLEEIVEILNEHRVKLNA